MEKLAHVASRDLCTQKPNFILHDRRNTVELLIKKGSMMLAEVQNNCRFVRKTQLRPNEYRKNFHQIDRDVMEVITSSEADHITPLMSKIYLRLVNAPARYWEREGVLRIEAELQDEAPVKAWAVLCGLLGVASATASKALRWMHEQGIIGYFSGKNGVGIRIFLNRATSSIGVRANAASKKILDFPAASSGASVASRNEPAFNDSYAVRDSLDIDKNPRAPENGAPETCADREFSTTEQRGSHTTDVTPITDRIVREIGPQIRTACAHEHERTREWFQSHALPKAIRVSQAAAYDVLRSYGVIVEARSRGRKAPAHSRTEAGKQTDRGAGLHRLSDEDIADYAQTCIALLVTQGQSVEDTLSEMSVDAGGLLQAEDALRVRAQAEALIRESEAEGERSTGAQSSEL